MKTLLNISTLLFCFLSIGIAWGAESPYTIGFSVQCEFYELVDGKWAAIPMTLPAGTVISGEAQVQRPDLILFKLEQRTFLISNICAVKPMASPSATPVDDPNFNPLIPSNMQNQNVLDTTPAPFATPEPAPQSFTQPQISEPAKDPKASIMNSSYWKGNFSNRPFSFFLSFLSWQESPSLYDKVLKQSNALQATIMAVCPGILYLFDWPKGWKSGADFCAILGSSEVKEKSSATVAYRSDGDFIYGAKFGLSIHRFIFEDMVSVGISAPIIIRFQKWPTPNSDFSLDGGTIFAFGAAAESRIYYSRFYLQPKFGFARTFSNLFFGVDLGFVF